MDYIKGFTFRFLRSSKQSFSGNETKESLKLMKMSTASDTVVFAIGALQEHPQSEHMLLSSGS